jgi:hypothetical protein
MMNDETFGAPLSGSNLPSFFQNPGTTVLDELAGLGISDVLEDVGGGLNDDETFGGDEYTGNEKLPDFFGPKDSTSDSSFSGLGNITYHQPPIMTLPIRYQAFQHRPLSLLSQQVPEFWTSTSDLNLPSRALPKCPRPLVS